MRVLIFVPELHGNLVVGEAEKFFTEAVRFLFLPLLGQECDDGVRTLEKGTAVAPDAVCGVAGRDFDWGCGVKMSR